MFLLFLCIDYFTEPNTSEDATYHEPMVEVPSLEPSIDNVSSPLLDVDTEVTSQLDVTYVVLSTEKQVEVVLKSKYTHTQLIQTLTLHVFCS